MESLKIMYLFLLNGTIDMDKIDKIDDIDKIMFQQIVVRYSISAK